MAEQSFDARRIAREQEGRIAAATTFGLNAMKPVMQFQVSILRLMADNMEMFARNYERGLETLTSTVEQQAQQRSAA
jgi:fumarate hydratase class II